MIVINRTMSKGQMLLQVSHKELFLAVCYGISYQFMISDIDADIMTNVETFFADETMVSKETKSTDNIKVPH